MRRIQTEQIKGGEILGKDIYNSSGAVLISSGTVLKKEYGEHLKGLRVSDIFVEDNISKDIHADDITEEKISSQCTMELQNTIERFSYAADAELRQLTHVAQDVMKGVLEQKEVVYNISNVRSYSRSLYEHCLSVGALSTLIAIHSGYGEKATNEIAIGALLHDIGFMSINADYQQLLLEEAEEKIQKEIKRHVLYGYSVVEHQDWLSNISKDIILYHHERLDGTGYPFHMRGKSVCPEVKLVALCDAFDSMVYGNLQKRMKVYEAMEYIVGTSGTKFDRGLVNLFVNSVAAYPIGTIVSLSNGERGIVIRQNKQTPTRPIVSILECNEDGGWERTMERDLIEELTLFIVDTIEE